MTTDDRSAQPRPSDVVIVKLAEDHYRITDAGADHGRADTWDHAHKHAQRLAARCEADIWLDDRSSGSGMKLLARHHQGR